MAAISVSTIPTILSVFCVAVNANIAPRFVKNMKVNITGILTVDCPEGDTSCSWPTRKVEDGKNAFVLPPAEGELVTTCEGTRLYLRCMEPNKTISIISGLYGRLEPGSKICPHDTTDTTSCSNPSSEKIILEECQGRGSCEISATNSVFGDPCVGTHKYLRVQFKCIDPVKEDPFIINAQV